MAEEAFTGLTAKIQLEGSDVAYVSGFDLTLTTKIIEILAFGAEFKEKRASINDWKGSINGTVAFAAGGSQQILMTAYLAGTPLTFGAFLDDATYFTGDALVSSLKISSKVEDATTLTADLDGTGALVLTVPAGLDATSVTITEGATANITVGGTKQLHAVVHSGASLADIQNVVWLSATPAKILVNPETGLLTGVTAGPSIITVESEDGNYVATITVTAV